MTTHSTSATGPIRLSGRATPAQGVTHVTSASGVLTLTGDLQTSDQTPLAAFADFALYSLTDPDPAMTYADANNAGVQTNNTGYTTAFSMFWPPMDYQVSNGQLLWRRAAYMAVGFYLTEVLAGYEQVVTDVQVAIEPAGTTSPAAYSPPRALDTIVKPTRLNFCPNPSFETSTSGWTGVATGTVAQDSTPAHVPPADYDTLLMIGNLPSFYNTTSITTDGVTGYAPAWSASQLDLAGFGLGAEVTAGGIGFSMPAVEPDADDSVSCQGQQIPVGGATSAAFISFLGASVGASATVSGTVTLGYSDGSFDTVTLALSDWTLNSGGGSVDSSNQVAVTTPYHNLTNGTESVVFTYLFSATLPVDPARLLTSITLPDQPDMRIFAVSMASLASEPFGTFSGKVTVNASGDGVQIMVPWLIAGDSFAVSLWVQPGPGLASVTVSARNSATVSGTGGANLAEDEWFTPEFSFEPTGYEQMLTITATTGAGFSSPSHFWVDAVLIEAGTSTGGYFDGSFGSSDQDDYQWESAPNLSRSYYYQQFNVRQQTVAEVLSQHVPLGISAAAPVYAETYTQ